MLDAHDLAKVYYSAARAEIVQRLAMREQVLLAAVATFGVIGGLFLSGHILGARLLGTLFPFLSFVFTMVLLRHDWLMVDLADYINSELGPSLGLERVEASGEPQMPIHWDAWLRWGGRHMERRKRHLKGFLITELLGSLLLLWLPGFAFLLCIKGGVLLWVDIGLLIVPFVLFVWQFVRLWELE
jgi:hypothetical protein